MNATRMQKTPMHATTRSTDFAMHNTPPVGRHSPTHPLKPPRAPVDRNGGGPMQAKKWQVDFSFKFSHVHKQEAFEPMSYHAHAAPLPFLGVESRAWWTFVVEHLWRHPNIYMFVRLWIWPHINGVSRCCFFPVWSIICGCNYIMIVFSFCCFFFEIFV